MHVRSDILNARSVFSSSILALGLAFTGCKSAPPAAPVDDASLTAAVQSRIAAETSIGTSAINSSVQNGIATLDGNVSSDAARAMASSDAAQIAGIKTVVNNLIVQQPPPAPAAAAVSTPPPFAAPKKTPAAKLKPAPVVREAGPVPPPTQQAYAPPPPPRVQAPPPPPPPPAFRSLTLAANTTLPVRITQTLDSATTQPGETFTGTIASDIIVDGLVALRQGTPVSGRVDAVQEAAHFKGNSLLTVVLTGINRQGERIALTSDPYSVQGKGRGKNTAEKVGGGAAVGAILGGIFGGGKGAAIGAAAGGGVGAGANTITRGEQVQIPSESLVRFHITNPIPLRVSTRDTQDGGQYNRDNASPGLNPRQPDLPQQ
ncbi:MAG: BON domain-containing protein [Acidobacteriota bacterium]|nr:BON domain-containing protein [Acidobacteriota bacterium]